MADDLNPDPRGWKGGGRGVKLPPRVTTGMTRNGKYVLVGGSVVLVGAILVGILIVRKPKPADHAGSITIAAVPTNLAHPPTAPVGPGAYVPTETQGLTTAGGGVVLHGGAAADAGAAQRSANTQYRVWLVKHHYKRLEHLVEARDRAIGANLSAIQGMAVLAGAAGTTSGHTPVAYPPSDGDSSSGVAGITQALQAALHSGQDPNLQGEKISFVDQQKILDHNGYLVARLHKPASPYEIFAGSIIPAVMITGINSDLPGEITAQVRQTVYNSLGDQVLIPQGAKLIGIYDSHVAFGQARVLVAWNRLIYPNGDTIALHGMPGANPLGEAGLHDAVNNHYLKIFGSAMLISMLGVGAQLSQPQNASLLTAPTVGQQAAASAANELNQVGGQLLQKDLNMQPTLVIRPGYLFNVLVTRTLILPPYSTPH